MDPLQQQRSKCACHDYIVYIWHICCAQSTVTLAYLAASSVSMSWSVPFQRRSGLHLLGPRWSRSSRAGPVLSEGSAACWSGTPDPDPSSGPPGRGRSTTAAWGASCPLRVTRTETLYKTWKCSRVQSLQRVLCLLHEAVPSMLLQNMRSGQ